MTETARTLERNIDTAACTGCGNCANVCPGLLFQQQSPGTTPTWDATAGCIRCGQCVAACAPEAIDHAGLASVTFTPRRKELLPTLEQVTEQLSSRRSTRSFLPRKIERSVLEQVVSLAACAPSGHNCQSTRFNLIDDPDRLALVNRLTAEALLDAYRLLNNPASRFIARVLYGAKITAAAKIRSSIAHAARSTLDGRDRILRGAKAIIVFHGDPLAVMAAINAQLSLANAALAAQALGLGSFYCGYVLSVQDRSKALREALNIPRGNEVFGVLALGYPRVKYAKNILRKPHVVFG